MLRDTGCSEDVIWLVENHEMIDPLPEGSPRLIKQLLKLQEVDNLY